VSGTPPSGEIRPTDAHPLFLAQLDADSVMFGPMSPSVSAMSVGGKCKTSKYSRNSVMYELRVMNSLVWDRTIGSPRNGRIRTFGRDRE
jgi:hypothetical protein